MPLSTAGKLAFINLADHCKIDGTSDDSTGFTTAYTLASTLGMGLRMPGGTLVKGNDTLLSTVPIDLGGGTIKLKNGANTDLFSAQTSSINLSASFGTGIVGTLSNFSIRNGTLDGNKANQSSGTSYPLRFYGYGYKLENLAVKNGYSGGILCDFNAVTSAPTTFISHWRDVEVYDCNGIGIETGGSSDMKWSHIIVSLPGKHCVHIAPNAGALQCSDSHFWGAGSGCVGILLEADQCRFSNCETESNPSGQLVVLGNQNVWVNGALFTNPAANRIGIQMGQIAGGTPYLNSVYQSAGVTTDKTAAENHIITDVFNCQSGALNEVNVSNNIYQMTVEQVSGTAIASNSGYLASSSTGLISVTGLTADGSQGTGGVFQLGKPINSSNAFAVYNSSGHLVFNAATFTNTIQVLNGSLFQLASDNGSTSQIVLNASNGNIAANGQLATGQSATTPDPGAGGTITTANIGLARVTPAASRTGVILQAGTTGGQQVTVVNNSASFTIQFAVSGTSHVALGTGLTIPVNDKKAFIWDSVAGLWY